MIACASSRGVGEDCLGGRDVVFISLEGWDDIWRRNQFVCAELARRNPKSRILFVVPAHDVSNVMRRFRWREMRALPPWSPANLDNIVVFTPTKLLPNSLAIGRAINARSLRRQVVAEMGRLGLRRPLLWINDHSAGHLAGRLGEAGTIYDVTDDWISCDQSPARRERVRAEDAALCGRADAVIVCSERLREMKAAMVREPGRLHLIPNGVDASHYEGVRSAGRVPAAAAGWAKPVAGYTGTVHPDRVDVGLVAHIAASGKVGSVVLVGPNHLTADDLSRLRLANVHLVGPVPYAEIPNYMRAFDVCIVPHRVTEFTESLNPIKLWEYLAAGKPIVSTDVAGFRDWPGLVRIARTSNDLVEAVVAALNEGDGFYDARQSEASRHSWRCRVDAVERVLASCLSISS